MIEPESIPAEAATANARAMSERVRGFLPVVVDVVAGGFDWTQATQISQASPASATTPTAAISSGRRDRPPRP